MIDVLNVIEKLKDILANEYNKKVYDKDVATALEISQANFATMKTRNRIPFSNILDFCALKKISINWLFYGQDPSSLVDSTDRYWIRYFPTVKMSAGGGGEHDEQIYERLELPPYFYNMLGGEANLKNIEAITVTGDSMEPTLNDGHIIFIDKTKRETIKDGIYAFSNTHGLFVKRIQKRIDGKLDIISDNKEYNLQVVSKEEISVLGKVICSFGSIY